VNDYWEKIDEMAEKLMEQKSITFKNE